MTTIRPSARWVRLVSFSFGFGGLLSFCLSAGSALELERVGSLEAAPRHVMLEHRIDARRGVSELTLSANSGRCRSRNHCRASCMNGKRSS